MEQTMTIKGRKRVSREEIIKVQEKANRKAMTVRRVRTGALIAANVLVSLFVLLPLLYAVSVAFMPPGELFTTEMNLVPRQPTWDNFRQALVKIPLVRFVCNSFITAGLITAGQIIHIKLSDGEPVELAGFLPGAHCALSYVSNGNLSVPAVL